MVVLVWKLALIIRRKMVFKQIIFATVFCVSFLMANAQKKYALLVGINNYYEQPGKISSESLKGSVNDADAIRNLLINKFGFSSRNIDTVYNATATRDNIISALKQKLDQCHKGDIMVFYYSGHGVYLNNSAERDDAVKRGMSQAILTSDLYNFRNNFKCFLRDFTLKTWFNYFVDKSVTLTVLVDCCFSENLAMTGSGLVKKKVYPDQKEKYVSLNQLMYDLTADEPDPEKVLDSIAGIAVKNPDGCKTDASGAMVDKHDDDGDGVPDCKDFQLNTAEECFPVDSNGVGKCNLDFLMQTALNKYDASEISQKQNQMIATRNFNPAAVLNIAEKDTVARPSERKNSKFLFLAATQDWQKALEFRENNNDEVHGLFTAAILRAYKSSSSKISAQELFNKIDADIRSKAKEQNPALITDDSRRKMNLIGQ